MDGRILKLVTLFFAAKYTSDRSEHSLEENEDDD
jgi:hypothetical protein